MNQGYAYHLPLEAGQAGRPFPFRRDRIRFAPGAEWESARLRLIEGLLLHVCQFGRVRQALAAAEALGAVLAGQPDSEHIGALQLDRGGRVLASNAPALEVLRCGDGLLDEGGTLRASLPSDQERLQRLLGRALPDWRGEAPGGGSMTDQHPSGRSRLGLHVMPAGHRTEDFGGRRVAALVLVGDPAGRLHIDAARVAATLGLTPPESRMK